MGDQPHLLYHCAFPARPGSAALQPVETGGARPQAAARISLPGAASICYVGANFQLRRSA
jgi:hypothetical protein